VLLTLVFGPGAGQVIIGRIIRGVLWALVPWLVLVPMFFVVGAWFILALPLVLLGAMVDAAVVRPPAAGPRRWGPSLGICVALVVGGALLSTATRTFLFAAYRIPAGSMVPTLEVGDDLYVTKLPFEPRLGDVILFRYPKKRERHYIKRVVAVGGDIIAFRNEQIILNGKPVPRRPLQGPCEYRQPPDPEQGGEGKTVVCRAFEETLGGHRYHVIQGPTAAPLDHLPVTVPPGHLFVMGDNRDNSHDSRFWGPVPPGDVVGRAASIWFSSGPEGIRWERMMKPVR
jgi:signal peptidase I